MIIHIKAFANFREILGRDTQVELDEAQKLLSSWIAFAYLSKSMKSALFDESGKGSRVYYSHEEQKRYKFIRGAGDNAIRWRRSGHTSAGCWWMIF